MLKIEALTLGELGSAPENWRAELNQVSWPWNLEAENPPDQKGLKQLLAATPPEKSPEKSPEKASPAAKEGN